MFAQRTSWKLSLNRISQARQALEKERAKILDLSQSNPTRAGFDYSGQVLRALTATKNVRYDPSPQGLEAARGQVAAYYAFRKIHVKPEDIFITASTSEAYSYLFRLLLNPGEEVLAPVPGYPLFEFLASLHDISLVPYRLRYETRWHFDSEALRTAVTPRSRAIVAVHPGNPTGNFFTRAEIKDLNAAAKSGGMAVIADEVFLDYADSAHSKQIQSFAQNKEVLTFTLSGISKTLALPQMKLGWIVLSGPERLKREARARLEIIADTFLSVSTPAQNALDVWMKTRRQIQRQIRRRIRTNQKFIEQIVRSHPALASLKREGGWYAVLRIPRVHTEEEWVLLFLEKDHVLIQPGYFFDFEEEAYVVVSLITEENIFRQGMGRIVERIIESCNPGSPPEVDRLWPKNGGARA